MSTSELETQINRFKVNEERLNTFVNVDGFYTTSSGVQVPTLLNVSKRIEASVENVSLAEQAASIEITRQTDLVIAASTSAQAEFLNEDSKINTLAKNTIADWLTAIATITQTEGVPALAVSTANNETQQSVNDSVGAKWYPKGGGYPINYRVMLDNGDIVKSTVADNTANPNVDMTGWKPQGNKSVAAPNDLTSIQNPKDGQVVSVESLQKSYIYNSANTYTPNGVTIVGKWEMELQNFYYATWFADSTSPLDQSAALHVGYSYATSKGKPYVVDAPFNVSGTFATFADDSHKTAFPLLSNSVVKFTPNGKLKMITNGLTSYQIMTAYNISNYRVLFPNLEGDKDTHDYTAAGTHEWGFGFVAYQSKGGYVHKLKASNCTGDPLYIGRSWGAQTHDVPKNIIFFEPDLSDSRRNGISVCAWDNVQIIRPVMGDIRGVEPQAGIDIEPEQSPDTYETFPLICKGLLIDNPKIDNCVRPINFYTALTGVDIQVDITGETIASNCDILGSFTLTNSNSGRVYIEKIYALNSTVADLYWGWSAAGSCKLEINEVQSNREDRVARIYMYIFGERPEKFLGNLQILLNFPVRAVFEAIGYVDYSAYTIRNLDIRNKYEMDGLPPYVIVETTPTKPITSYPTYAPTYLLGKIASYIESPDGVVMSNRKHTNDLWVGDFSGTARIELLSYFGTFKLTFPRSSTATGVEIANANVLDDTGAVKSVITTTKKDSWIIIRKTSSGSEIIDKSAGWVFS